MSKVTGYTSHQARAACIDRFLTAHAAQLVLELLDNRRPALATGMLAGIQAHPAQTLGFFQ